jgi:hypothetical protein
LIKEDKAMHFSADISLTEDEKLVCAKLDSLRREIVTDEYNIILHGFYDNKVSFLSLNS